MPRTCFWRRLRWLAPAVVGLAALLAGPAAAPAQSSAARDQLSEFRRILKDVQPDALAEKDKPGKSRKDQLTAAAKRIDGVGALRRALALQEWQDDNRDETVAAIDLAVRKDLGERLEKLLRGVLKSGDPLARLAAARLIGEMATQIRSLEPGNRTSYCRVFGDELTDAAKNDPDPAVRVAAARSLGSITPDPAEAVPTLKGLLTDGNPEVARGAVDGLANLLTGAFVMSRVQTTIIIEIDRKEQVEIAQKVAPLLGDVLRTGGDPQALASAVNGLMVAADALVDMVPDPRRDAAAGIDRAGLSEEDRASLVPVARVFADQADGAGRLAKVGPDETRLKAARVLQDIGLARVKLLGRSNNFVPPTSSRPDAGGTLPPPKAEPAKPRPGNQSRRRPPAPVILGRLAPASAVPDGLLAQADDAKPDPKDDAEKPVLKNLLAQLPAIAEGLNNPNRDVRVSLLHAIEVLGRDAGPASPILVQAMKDGDIFVRWVAARTAGRVAPEHDGELIPALIPLLADRDLDVRLVALAAIERFGDKGRPAIPELVRTSLRGDGEVRIVAVRVLEAVGATAGESVPAFIKGLGNPDERVRIAVIGALERLGPPAAAALPALKERLTSDDAEERAAAADAILSITSGS